MQRFHIPFWKTSPFTRLLIPLMGGIMLQWYLQVPVIAVLAACSSTILVFIALSFFNLDIRFRFRWLQGFFLQATLVFFAMLLVWHNTGSNRYSWYGHYLTDSSQLVISINEPLVEKERSLKTEVIVESVINNGRVIQVNGKLTVYFSKDTAAQKLRYGNRILISNKLAPVKNSGNPGAFDYKRYAAFHQLYHSAYLQPNDWMPLTANSSASFRSFIFSCRAHIVQTVKQYTYGSIREKGIAEALLIGYKEDLDKDLVQAYSNAGVVHIIAISGLHLGLIYIMLDWILSRLPYVKKRKAIKIILLLGSLWLFAILTGSSASVLRSAVMFSFIVIGKNYFKQSSVYNSLASSAFMLLCYDPFFLWDVGFQLSYLALIGIVMFQQPITRLVYVKNKWLAKTWGMVAVTTAAQVATFPLCLYYFHQFPNLFIFTNLLAVPLSTMILFAEILMLTVSGIPALAVYAGKITGLLTRLMNEVISATDKLPFSVWDNIYANTLTTVTLYLFIIGVYGWLQNGNRILLRLAAISLTVFTGTHAYERMIMNRQVKMIVYNIPKMQAIDFIERNRFLFIGDTALRKKGMLQHFHLEPSRVSLHVNIASSSMDGMMRKKNLVQFYNKRIMLVDSSIAFEPLNPKLFIDVLVISKNPNLTLSGITSAIRPSMVVFDASNSLWKIAKWKKECIMLALPCFSIPVQGAYVLDIK